MPCSGVPWNSTSDSFSGLINLICKMWKSVWMFSEVPSGPMFSFSYSPTGELRGDYFQDRDCSQVLFARETSLNRRAAVC